MPDPDPHSHSWRLGTLAAALLVSVVLIPALGLEDRAYPFFSWALFSRVAARGTDYDLALGLKDGRRTLFTRCAACRRGEQRLELWNRIQDLGQARADGADDPRAARDIRDLLPVEAATVRLVRIKGFLADHLVSEEEDVDDLGPL